MTGDPFFDEFHRLRPDVHVVLLPPPAPAVAPGADDVPDVSLAAARARAEEAREQAAALLRRWWPVLSAGRTAPSTIRASWTDDAAPGTVRAVALGRATGPVGDPVASVTSLGDVLGEQGWRVQVRPAGAERVRLEAESDGAGVEVRCWGSEGPWDVSVAVRVVVGEHGVTVRGDASADLPWAVGGDAAAQER